MTVSVGVLQIIGLTVVTIAIVIPLIIILFLAVQNKKHKAI